MEDTKDASIDSEQYNKQTVAFSGISRLANLNGVRIANHVRKEEEVVIGSRGYHARRLAVGTQPRLAWTAHPGIVDERTPVEGQTARVLNKREPTATPDL